ncbi:hypothetical protein Riv7116_1849 [Rivularia sp. PCC 7116]|uniref:hypothetical protein n=1 Tax=Rivularia sp. PCC 7116 TaxID=373994 RepID=UPI00029ED843|nr:hypothetical protein [Rivularia sp. PCC 7116]AFY54390.1 hypothetical protein Riv7116_1849 [Rivularia sp. PCC 7116]
MSKYAFSKLQKLIRRYHNLQIKREIAKKDIKNTKKNIYQELLIESNDTAQSMILKILFLWISTGNLDKFISSTLPSGWAIKPGDFLPQLVVVYRIRGKTRTGNYELTIPHYKGSRYPVLPFYKKGSHKLTLVLKDGSKLIINAATESEGRRVISQYSKYVDSKFLTNDIRHTENQLIKVNDMIPVRADYYPSGQNNSNPLWRFYPTN